MSATESFVLGIEGGGTKTTWVLAKDNGAGLREDAIVRRGVLPASNLRLSPDDRLHELFSVLPRDAARVGVFLAGCATEADHERLRRIAGRVWPEAALAIGNDRDTAMAAAFRDGDGIVVIAGTGAVVHGRRGNRTAKAGGWGQLLGDRGGGYHIAMQGLRSVLTHYDLQHEVSALAQTILRMLSLNKIQDLVDWASQADKMSVARLAPAVFEAARNGDPEPCEIIESGASILADFTHAVAARLETSAPSVALYGGVFSGQREYVELFERALTETLPHATVSLCEGSGALAAAWLASGAAGSRSPSERAEGADGRLVQAVTEQLNRGELAAAPTEQRNERSIDLDQMPTAELVRLFIDEEECVQQALAARAGELTKAVEIVSSALLAGGRLFYAGAGTSGRLGVLDASEIPPTFGASPETVQGIMAGGETALHRAVEGAEDEPEAGALAILERGVQASDVVCGITASGRTPFVLGALRKARSLRAATLLITCNPARRKEGERWNLEIDLPTGPELITGSTRLKAGTATKVALNIISSCAMVRLGKVQGNAMVDVRISNEKLRDRGIRLVSEMLSLSYEDALALLEANGWNVRRCIEIHGARHTVPAL